MSTTNPPVSPPFNQKKFKNFLKKYEGKEWNKENYQIGGGLAGGMSRRNDDAKYDEGKLTVDQASKKISEIFGVEKSLVVDLFDSFFPQEWHHAGFMPKQYGGGMRKIYYLNAEQMVEMVNNFQLYLDKKKIQLQEIAQAEELKRSLEIRQQEFINQFGKVFSRIDESKLPHFYIETAAEMNGKFGWFDAAGRSYKLPIYYSGIEFETEEKLKEYQAIR